MTIELDLTPATTARAAARGLVAAMAMTGMRTVSQGLGLLEKSPPEAILGQRGPRYVSELTGERRAVVTEIAHWAYGAAGGAGFGLLSPAVRGHRWAGPAYGLAIWLCFELGLAPVLGVRHVEQRRIVPRAMIALDHLLYGVVVAGRLAPEPSVAHPRRDSRASGI